MDPDPDDLCRGEFQIGWDPILFLWFPHGPRAHRRTACRVWEAREAREGWQLRGQSRSNAWQCGRSPAAPSAGELRAELGGCSWSSWVGPLGSSCEERPHLWELVGISPDLCWELAGREGPGLSCGSTGPFGQRAVCSPERRAGRERVVAALGSLMVQHGMGGRTGRGGGAETYQQPPLPASRYSLLDTESLTSVSRLRSESR